MIKYAILSFLAWLMAGGTGMASVLAQEKNVRVLFDFENPADIAQISEGGHDVVFDRSPDHSTSGACACRMTFRKGGDYAEIHFTGERREGWQHYDYFAMDVFATGNDRVELTLELWDARSRNYPTRCSLVATVVPGKQTILIPINRAKRNGKEGRDWSELEAHDKIDVAALTRCKIFLTTPRDHDLVWYVDRIRLLKEDALGLKMDLKLPAGATAVRFGKGKAMDGFTVVSAATAFDGKLGFTAKPDLADCGRNWPDPLTGNGVYSPSGKPFVFEAALPDGDYGVWLAAGLVLKKDIAKPRFLLRVGGETLYDDQPAPGDLYGENYFFRFMRTVYSGRPNALWLDYIDRMYPVHERLIRVTGGRLVIEACGVQLSALIVLPAKDQAAFTEMSRAIRAARMELFRAAQPPFAPAPVARGPGDGELLCFVPDNTTPVRPDTLPKASERGRKAYDLAGAQGQNLIFRLGVSAFEDLGVGTVSISELTGPGSIPASSVRWHFQNFRQRGVDLVEDALLPTNAVPLEKGLTRCFWAWMKIPDSAAAGEYAGQVSFACGGRSEILPVKLTVYPFKLEPILPYSFGMWYTPPETPDPADGGRVTAAQLAFLREIGMTGITIANPDRNGGLDAFLPNLAKAAGMGRGPGQLSMTSALGMARLIGRGLPGLSGVKMDSQPGCEFDHPDFKNAFMNSARKLAVTIRESGLPLAVQTVDEPRETPNPWNRNLDQTNLYADWLREAGIRNLFVDPMGDSNGGKDYTPLIAHHDIIGTHAGRPSEKLMTRTLEQKKTLWLYNTGMDRLSWGFYNWRVGSVGRWEWHFRWAERNGANGYLNDEWYNPFTGLEAFAPEAPIGICPGAMLFQSAFLTCADGITDSAYLYTLEQALRKAKGSAIKRESVAKTEAFLARLKEEIPFLPGVQGISGAGDGALVGQGLQTTVADQCETWRRKIARLVVELEK